MDSLFEQSYVLPKFIPALESRCLQFDFCFQQRYNVGRSLESFRYRMKLITSTHHRATNIFSSLSVPQGILDATNASYNNVACSMIFTAATSMFVGSLVHFQSVENWKTTARRTMKYCIVQQQQTIDIRQTDCQ